MVNQIYSLSFQYEHYFETTHDASYGKEPKPVSKDLLHLPGKSSYSLVCSLLE